MHSEAVRPIEIASTADAAKSNHKNENKTVKKRRGAMKCDSRVANKANENEAMTKRNDANKRMIELKVGKHPGMV